MKKPDRFERAVIRELRKLKIRYLTAREAVVAQIVSELMRRQYRALRQVIKHRWDQQGYAPQYQLDDILAAMERWRRR